MVRLRVVVALQGGGPDGMPLLRWTIVRLIEALKESPIPVTVEIESEEDS